MRSGSRDFLTSASGTAKAFCKYIDENPVKAGLADKPENYPYGSAYFRARKKALRA